MSKAQVSLEVLGAITILLLTLILIFFQLNFLNQRISFLENTGIEERDCAKLSSAINLVQSASGNSQIELTIDSDASINGSFIQFTNIYCNLHGVEITSNLLKGQVMIKKNEGVISVENF
ncbi:MAG: hypothetical protein NUV57_00480 [archaeon]|nr:hypothetical protein [archaeon]